MGEKMVRVCDVYGTAKGVKRYRVLISEIGAHENDIKRNEVVKHIDLGKRGLDRLLHYVNKGVNPPNQQADEAPEVEPDDNPVDKKQPRKLRSAG